MPADAVDVDSSAQTCTAGKSPTPVCDLNRVSSVQTPTVELPALQSAGRRVALPSCNRCPPMLWTWIPALRHAVPPSRLRPSVT